MHSGKGMSRYKEVSEDMAYRLLYPAPVYVISAAAGEDEDALSAVWVTPVSQKPARVGVAISPERYVYSLIRKSGFFAINKLPFHLTKQMAFIGDVSKRYQKNKLDLSGLHIGIGKTRGVRVIKEADAVIECKVASVQEMGDHDMFVGDILSSYATRDFDVVWDVAKLSYAVYVGSVGDGDSARRLFVSPAGDLEQTKWPRSEAVARRSRDHRFLEEACVGLKGKDLHEAAKLASAKTGVRYANALMMLEEMRRQGLVQLRGRLVASDFG